MKGQAMDDPGERYIATLSDDALEAVVETMVLVVYADGVLSAAERSRFAASLGRLGGARLSETSADELLRRVAMTIAARDRAASIAAIKQRLPDEQSRLVALVLATDMAAADGVIRETERKLVLEIGRELGIPAAETQALLDDAAG
jgi:tellurite resistance protein